MLIYIPLALAALLMIWAVWDAWLGHPWKQGSKNKKRFILKALASVTAFILFIVLQQSPNESEQSVHSAASATIEAPVGGKTYRISVGLESDQLMLDAEGLGQYVARPLLDEFADMIYESCETVKRELGMKLYEDGRYDSAALIWESLLEVCSDAQACFLAGTANVLAGDTIAGEKYLLHSIELDSSSASAWQNLGYIAFCRSGADSAITLLSKGISLIASGHLFVNRGLCYLSKGDSLSAYSDFYSAAEIDGSLWEAKRMIGALALEFDSLEIADRNLTWAYRQDSADVNTLNKLGVVRTRQELWPEAMSLFKRASVLAPDFVTARLNVGATAFITGDFHLADSVYSTIALDSLPLDAINSFARSCLYEGRLSKSKQVLLTGLRHSGDTKEFLLTLMEVYLREGDLDSVLLLANKPSVSRLVSTHELIANALYNAHGYQQAVEYCKERLAQKDTEQSAWNYLIGGFYFDYLVNNLVDNPDSLYAVLDSVNIYWVKYALEADDSELVALPQSFRCVFQQIKSIGEDSVKFILPREFIDSLAAEINQGQ